MAARKKRAPARSETARKRSTGRKPVRKETAKKKTPRRKTAGKRTVRKQAAKKNTARKKAAKRKSAPTSGSAVSHFDPLRDLARSFAARRLLR